MRNSFRQLLTFFISILLYNSVFSQQYFIKTYTIEDGLPTRNINDACQDSSGLMWFATSFGVSKYDGFSFTNYGYADGLPDQVYKKILIDEKGILWAMPDGKPDTIVYFKNNRWEKILPPGKELRNLQMNSFDVIYKNNKPVICMGSYNGIYTYENGAWSHIRISNVEESNYVYTVIADRQKFYLSTKIGLCIFENGKPDWSLNKLINPYGTDIISICFENKNTSDEKMWVLSEKWLGYIQHKQFRMVTSKFKLPHPTIYYYSYIEADKKGNVFFGNIWSKYVVSKSSDTPLPLMVNNGFSSDGATSVFVDREQNVWFTDTRGICKFNNLKMVNYFEKNGMRENEVSTIAEMNDGRIVLGHNSGLSILDNSKFKIIDFPEFDQENRRVLDMMKDNAGNIWFVSIGLGLGRLQPNGGLIWYKLAQYATTSAVHQDKSGRIWVGADRNLLYFQENKLIDFKPFNEKYNTIRRIFSDTKGGLFIAGRNGLSYLINDKVRKIPSPSDKKADNVYSYFKGKNGIELVGTMHGLYVIEKGQITKYSKNGIEINSPVFFIFQDRDENYWIGSNDGAYKWDGKSKLEVYNINNGLAGWETNRAAGMMDSKGRIWIGTDRGLSCLEPGYDITSVPIPDVKLLYTEDSHGEKHELSKESTINYDDNTLSFHFRGISFYNEHLIKYKYKLEGFDQGWQEINQSMLDKVKYIGLKPGKYTFMVMARNFSGTWSNIVRSETIRIKPPVYFTWWFLTLALSGLSAIIYGIILIRVQKTHNSKLEKEIVERKRIEHALTESRQKYQDLIELLPETIYETDRNDKLVYLNDTGFRLFGYQHTELPNSVSIRHFISPESTDEVSAHMDAAKHSKQPTKTVLTGIKKDGTTFPLSIHTVPVLYNEKWLGTRGIIIDLTEQKKFEAQLQKNAEDLKVLNNSKDKFFSIIAHDLRSPFTSFLGFTEILDEEINTLPKHELQTIITSMRTSASNLYQLLENLLEWAMLQREITRFEPKTMFLLPVVKNCYEVNSETLKQKQIEFRIEIPEMLKVSADFHMLQTIIRNLLSNAIKFTNRGGSIHISAQQTKEHFITFAVKDTGIGMSTDMLRKIFLIDTNNKTKGTDGELSTGLGLILCREFVEKHEGEIWVESEVGKGSTFYFTVKSISG